MYVDYKIFDSTAGPSFQYTTLSVLQRVNLARDLSKTIFATTWRRYSLGEFDDPTDLLEAIDKVVAGFIQDFHSMNEPTE